MRMSASLTSVERHPQLSTARIAVSSTAYSASSLFMDLLGNHQFLIVVWYRGNWCAWCVRYLELWNLLLGFVQDEGGTIIGLSAQPPEIAAHTRQECGLQYDLFSDEQCLMALEWGVFVSRQPNFKYGLSQPAVLVLKKAPVGDFEVLYKWVNIPSSTNRNGSYDRPFPGDIWRSILMKRYGYEVQDQDDLGLIPPPQEPITFVFTDVQASTALWADLPEVMAVALEIHDRLMRRSCAKYNAYEIKTEGDAFHLAFASPRDAVCFCMAVQRELLETKWPASLLRNPHTEEVLSPDGSLMFRGLRVRMAMHLGPAEQEVSILTGRMEYYGPAIAETHAIEQVTDGGTCVVSHAVYQAVQGHWLEVAGEMVEFAAFAPTDAKPPPALMPLYRIQTSTLLPRYTNPPPRRDRNSSIVTVRSHYHGRKDYVGEARVGPSGAPEGLVTLVFISLQDTGPIWQSCPMAALATIKEYHRLVAVHGETFGAYEVKNKGEATMLAFLDPRDALRFALHVQRDALMTVSWPKAVLQLPQYRLQRGPTGALLQNGPYVSAGIHQGVPYHQLNPLTKRMDYFGPDVNKAARVAGRTKAGQILITESTRNKLGAPIDGVQFEALGTVPLKGIPTPEPLLFALFDDMREYFDSTRHSFAEGFSGPKVVHNKHTTYDDHASHLRVIRDVLQPGCCYASYEATKVICFLWFCVSSYRKEDFDQFKKRLERDTPVAQVMA